MGIYVKLNRKDFISRRDILYALTEFVLKSLNIQISNFSAFNEYPNESIGDLVYEVDEILTPQWVLGKHDKDSQFSKWFKKSDYLKIKGIVNSIPCVLILSNQTKGFEHEEFYFELYTDNPEYGQLLFPNDNDFNDFVDKFVRYLESSSDVVKFAFIGNDVEVIIEWNRAWMIWYLENYDFIYDLITFFERISKQQTFQRSWLDISSEDLKKVIDLLRYLRKDLVAGAYSKGRPLLKRHKTAWSKDPVPEVTPLHEYLLTTQQLGIARAEAGSLLLSCRIPGSTEIQKALNELLIGIVGSITSTIDIDKIGTELANNAIKYFQQLRKS